MTSPLHLPSHLPYICPSTSSTSPVHLLCTPLPHTPYGVAPPTAGACPLKGKVSVTPLALALALGINRASAYLRQVLVVSTLSGVVRTAINLVIPNLQKT